MSETSRPDVPADSVTLPSGAAMPTLGFGTWQIKGDEAVAATAAALEAGYRHLDTATVYGNEGEVGRGLAESGVARDDVFLTTKCPPRKVGHELETLRESLDLLGTDHVDLWLIHWPGAAAPTSTSGAPSWRPATPAWPATSASATSTRPGSTSSPATGVAPAVNQIEWSPLLFDGAVVAAHRSAGSSWRATARCAAAPSSTRRSRGSRSGSGARRPR